MAVRSTSEPLNVALNLATSQEMYLAPSIVAAEVVSVHRCTSRLGIILVRSRKDSQQASNDIAVENH
jgi:hypothetical protein